MTGPIEVSVRNGRDYMRPRQRALYCQFEAPEPLSTAVEQLVDETPAGPPSAKHLWQLSRFVKRQVTYDTTGRYPRGTDYLLKQTASGDSGGDCVDQSVLLASLLQSAGFTTRYCCFLEPDNPVGHCVVQVRTNDTEGLLSEVETVLRAKVRHGASAPIAWDVDEESDGRWLLIDPTSMRPTGFDRGTAFEVTTDGIRWKNDVNVVCFRRKQSDDE